MQLIDIITPLVSTYQYRHLHIFIESFATTLQLKKLIFQSFIFININSVTLTIASRRSSLTHLQCCKHFIEIYLSLTEITYRKPGLRKDFKRRFTFFLDFREMFDIDSGFIFRIKSHTIFVTKSIVQTLYIAHISSSLLIEQDILMNNGTGLSYKLTTSTYIYIMLQVFHQSLDLLLAKTNLHTTYRHTLFQGMSMNRQISFHLTRILVTGTIANVLRIYKKLQPSFMAKSQEQDPLGIFQIFFNH